MFKFLITRISSLLAVLLTMVAVVFLLRQVLPGDPARAAVGPNAPASVVAAKRTELGLDRPIWNQFGRYLGQLLRGDLGTSTRTTQPVRRDLVAALPASIELLLAAFVLALLIGFGVAIAVTLVPRLGFLRWALIAGGSAPIFLTGLVGLLVFWYELKVFPGGGRSIYDDVPTGPTGMLTVDGLLHGRLAVSWDAVQHLLLPGLTLALPMSVAVGRSMLSSLAGTMRSDHVRTARSKGLTEARVLTRHGLRNSATAPLAMIGLQVGILFANLLLVEQIFSWPGVGLYTVQSLGTNDLSAVLGSALLFGILFVTVGLVIDLLQAFSDPRITLQG